MALVIAGLGNPGDKYARTRHNIGFMLLDMLAEKWNLTWKEGFKGHYASHFIAGEKIHLIKPMTYMNLSGECIAPFCAYFKIEPEELVLAHDELDYEFGKLKLLKGGGAAGHNGVSSVTLHMGTPDYYRLRLGIAGIPREKMRGYSAQYVLADFTKDERESLPDFLGYAAEAVASAAENGISKAMNLYNRKRTEGEAPSAS